MKPLLPILVLAGLLNCINQSKYIKQVDERVLYQKDKHSGIFEYSYESKFYKQIVDIEFLSNIEIYFRIITTDKKANNSSIIEGNAKRDIDQDPEQDEDEAKIPYDSYQYLYSSGECKVLIRISKDKKDLMKIDSFKCYNLIGKSNGLFTLEVLLKRVQADNL